MGCVTAGGFIDTAGFVIDGLLGGVTVTGLLRLDSGRTFKSGDEIFFKVVLVDLGTIGLTVAIGDLADDLAEFLTGSLRAGNFARVAEELMLFREEGFFFVARISLPLSKTFANDE